MPRPRGRDPRVDHLGLGRRLDPQRVGVVVSAVAGRYAQMDHRVVACELLGLGGTDRTEQLARTRPVGDAIDRPAIAQHDRGIARRRCCLEFALDEEDRALGGAANVGFGATRKASAENDPGGLRQHVNVLTERLADQLEHGRLPRARPAGQHDPGRRVDLGAFDHASTSVAPSSGTIASQPNESRSRRRNASAAAGSPWVTNTRGGESPHDRSHSISSR